MCEHLKACKICQEFIAGVIADTVNDMCEEEVTDESQLRGMDTDDDQCGNSSRARGSRQLRELPRPTPVVMSSAAMGTPRSQHSRSQAVPHMVLKPSRSTTSRSSLASTTQLPREQPRSPERSNGPTSMTTTGSTWSNST